MMATAEEVAETEPVPTSSSSDFRRIEFWHQTPAPLLVRAFAHHFCDQIWPGSRLPALFYDPRSLETEGSKRAVLHAKAVAVDARWTLLTSANFTEAAHERNRGDGVVIEDGRLAERMTRPFDRCVAAGRLRALVTEG
jgi:phosphatidylserine/phosphatidylglycerophosphate/cardiolipin synthase-like enzyme